jgi:hypothetical protein
MPRRALHDMQLARNPVHPHPRHPAATLPAPQPRAGLFKLRAVPGGQLHPLIRQLSLMTASADCYRRKAIPVVVPRARCQFQFGGAGRLGPTMRIGRGYIAERGTQQIECGTTG